MRRASVVTSIIFIFIIAGLAYLLYLQTKEYRVYQSKTTATIKTLKSKVKELEEKLQSQRQKSHKEVKEKKKKEQTIPKDAVVIKVPKVPKVTVKVPQVVTIGGSKIEPQKDVQLSMEMPAEYKEIKQAVHKEDNSSNKKEAPIVGLVALGRVSTYLRAPLNEDPKELLKKAGFTILAEKKIDNDISSIIFTNKDLEAMGEKSPFIADLRVLVDHKNKKVTIQNPIYFGKAFMQENYNAQKAESVLKAINHAFANLKASKDKLKATLLPNYQFMFGMPYYKDMITVAKAKTSDALVVKIDKKSLIYSQKVGKDSYIIGLNLNRSVESFVNKIGKENATLLPYPVMVQNGEAKILDPKYYIAISYPMLKMSQFMSISSVPDEIVENIKGIIK